MNILAKIVTRRAWLVLGGVVLLVIAALWNGVRPEPEDDILKFLPPGDPDIQMFRRISEQFGGLEVAMVGIETGDVFEPEFLKRLDRLTGDLRETSGVDRVVSLTNLADFEPDKVQRGIKAGELIDVRQFSKPGYLSGLRARVLGKEHVVGQFVDIKGSSTLVLCFLVPGVNQKQVVDRIKEVSGRHMGKERLYWGGAPFASAYVFEATEKDIRTLTPWALLVIIVIMLFAFRDPLGVVLSLLSTAVGALVAFSLMVAFDVKLNLVLSSMPVILFAVGSAYGIHILSRYYKLAETLPRQDAIRRSLAETGPAVLATGITTMAGFLSFVVMDIPPMRLFGIFTAVGIGAAMLTALLVIPAVLTLTGRFKRFGKGGSGLGWLPRQLGRLSAAGYRRRGVTLIVASVLAVAGIVISTQIKVEVEPSAFYSSGSPPAVADEFMGRKFGGSQFVQVHFDLAPTDATAIRASRQSGKAVSPFSDPAKPVIEDPLVLKEVRRFAEIMAMDPDVSSVLHIGLPISLGNEMAEDLRRIPDTREKVKNIYGLVSTDPTMSQLLSPSHRDLLVHVKIRSSSIEVVNRVLARATTVIEKEFRPRLVPVDLGREKPGPRRDEAVRLLVSDTASHVVASARFFGVVASKEARDRVHGELAARFGKPVEVSAESRRAVAENLTGFLLSSEFPGIWPKLNVDEDPYDKKKVASDIAQALSALGPGASERARDGAVKQAAAEVLGTSRCLDFSSFLGQELEHGWHIQRGQQLGLAAARALGQSKPSAALHKALATAALDLDAPVVALPAPAGAKPEGLTTIRPTVSGMPVVLRGLARSVQLNQIFSLAASLVVVLLVMVIMFRSFVAGIVAILPAGFTLVAVFGGLALLGKPLDISTSMVAGIAIGVGIDYAIHFLSWWQAPTGEGWVGSARRAAAESGGGILANALMVCVGFAVLALGESAPTKALGVMIAAAMLISALVTFLVVPAGAGRRVYYQRIETSEQGEAASQVAELATASPENSATRR
ncbi:MAG: MMPL family transporter [Polyangia bacterium]|nr:MMPL family transporter [Polyangia bacterium]